MEELATQDSHLHRLRLGFDYRNTLGPWATNGAGFINLDFQYNFSRG